MAISFVILVNNQNHILIKIFIKSSEAKKEKQTIKLHKRVLYRVTHQFEPNLLLISKRKFCFGLAWPDLDRPKQNFCFDINGRFGST